MLSVHAVLSADAEKGLVCGEAEDIVSIFACIKLMAK